MIVSNDMEKASIAAADALSQLEHDPDSRAFIISSNLKNSSEDKKHLSMNKYSSFQDNLS